MKRRVKVFGKSILFLVSGIILLMGAVYYGYNKFKNSGSDIKSSLFRSAPDFELPDPQGKVHSLKSLNGTAVLLHFWATWCPPCLNEIPEWVELATLFKGRPLKLVAVSLDQSWNDALKVLPSEKLPQPILSLLDASGKLPEQYGSYQFPETYLIGADQKIKMKWVGPQNWSSPEMRQFIERAIFH